MSESDSRRLPDLWVDPEDDPRHLEATELRGERAVLDDYLRHYRLTLELKCQGLDAEQLARRSVPPSSLSLLGLLRHLGGVEHSWCRRVVESDLSLPRLRRTEDGQDLGKC